VETEEEGVEVVEMVVMAAMVAVYGRATQVMA
jgi:hypothetical protein